MYFEPLQFKILFDTLRYFGVLPGNLEAHLGTLRYFFIPVLVLVSVDELSTILDLLAVYVAILAILAILLQCIFAAD